MVQNDQSKCYFFPKYQNTTYRARFHRQVFIVFPDKSDITEDGPVITDVSRVSQIVLWSAYHVRPNLLTPRTLGIFKRGS